MKASKVLFLVFLIILSLCVVNTQPVKAGGPIYIRADGSVEGTDKIQRDGDVYTFTARIYDSIVVKRDNIVVDGGGYTLQGTGTGTGIDLSGRKNVTVKNFEINQFETGINVSYCFFGGYNTISGNSMVNCGYGICMEHSHNNTIIGNNLNNNDCSVFIMASHFNVFKNNQLFDNRRSLVIQGGGALAEFTQYMDTSNTVNGKPAYYWVEEQDKAVPSDAGYVALTGCKNITVQNLKLTGNGQGIMLFSTKDSTITRNILKDNDAGIVLWDSLNSTVSENVIANNDIGVHIRGIFPVYSQNNRICGNNITNNGEGMYIFDSSNNTIYRNNIANNECGIRIIGLGGEAANNIIHHNNFVNNTADVPGYWSMIVFQEVWVPPQSNVWDDSKEGNYWSDYVTRHACMLSEVDGKVVFSVGSWNENYWSDYNGKDNNGDGIGDTPYIIDEKSQDNNPLMAPYSPSSTIQEFPDEENPPIPTQEPFQTTWIVASTAIIAIGSVALLFYFRKIKKPSVKAEKVMSEGVM